MSPPQGGCGPLVFVAGLVLTFINTVAFGRRCIPPRGVARRSNTLGILPPRALRGGRLRGDKLHGLHGPGLSASGSRPVRPLTTSRRVARVESPKAESPKPKASPACLEDALP